MKILDHETAIVRVKAYLKVLGIKHTFLDYHVQFESDMIAKFLTPNNSALLDKIYNMYPDAAVSERIVTFKSGAVQFDETRDTAIQIKGCGTIIVTQQTTKDQAHVEITTETIDYAYARSHK